MSCNNDIIDKDISHLNIFQAFWDVMDERYVFFEEKNLNWDSIYTVWQPKFASIHTDIEAVTAFDSLLTIIGDTHVSITTRDGIGIDYFWDNRSNDLLFGKIYANYNFSNIRQYSNINLAQVTKSIAYMRILSNLSNASGALINIEDYNFSDGLIVDLRDCNGGYETGYGICDLFFSGSQTICYEQYRNSPSHNLFTELQPITIKGLGVVGSKIPIVVLINNNTHSMGNSIAFIIKDLTSGIVIGERSGGGGGAVKSVFLPAGWGLTYTYLRIYNQSKFTMEDGLKPDVEVLRSQEFWLDIHQKTGEDPQLAKALELLEKNAVMR